MRVFFKEGSNILEITKEINRYKSDTYLLSMASADTIYIASDFPMNHFYVKMGDVVNETESSNGWLPLEIF